MNFALLTLLIVGVSSGSTVEEISHTSSSPGEAFKKFVNMFSRQPAPLAAASRSSGKLKIESDHDEASDKNKDLIDDVFDLLNYKKYQTMTYIEYLQEQFDKKVEEKMKKKKERKAQAEWMMHVIMYLTPLCAGGAALASSIPLSTNAIVNNRRSSRSPITSQDTRITHAILKLMEDYEQMVPS